MSIHDRLATLGITLPHAAAPAANYVPGVVHGGLLHISGQIPFDEDGQLIRGRVGDDMTMKEGAAAARRWVGPGQAQQVAQLGQEGLAVGPLGLALAVPALDEGFYVGGGRLNGQHARESSISAYGCHARPMTAHTGLSVEANSRDSTSACPMVDNRDSGLR